jgi:hypothetical protein
MNVFTVRCRRPIFIGLLTIAAVFVFPVSAALAYSHDPRDDQGSLYTSYFQATNIGDMWISQRNDYNGYDYDTAIDCLEGYDWCKAAGGTGDFATWYPYPSPSPYWMCPFIHIANYPGWGNANAEYSTEASGHYAYSTISQGQYLNAWYTAPNGDYTTNDWTRVTAIGGGGGTINADAADFHYNPLNANDSACH